MSDKTWMSLAAVVLLLAAVWGWLFSYPDFPMDPAWDAEPVSNIPEGAVTVRYSGTATLLFSDGETAWMTDGWFSRPGPLRLLYGEIEPDAESISYGLMRNNARELAAVIPLHSHYDHAMDAPEVALRTGAVVMGSEATANIARGWNLPEEQILLLQDRVSVEVGQFVVTPIESKHFQFPDPEMAERALKDTDITEPLVPPVSAFEYRLGKAYVLHVSHPKGTFLVVGSAGYVPGLLHGMQADAVFLGVGGLSGQSEKYRDEFWDETIGRVLPKTIYPIHWDSLTNDIRKPFTDEVRIASSILGGDPVFLNNYLRDKSEASGTDIVVLPRFEPVLLFP